MSGVQSIERAFLLMRALAVGPAGVTELADRVELPKSTVARLLATLEAEGAVAKMASSNLYQLGEALVDLAGSSAPGRNLIASARPHLVELTESTGETSGVSILSDDGVFYLDHVESDEDVQVRSWTGETVPAHLVPSGLVLLAHSPSEVRKAHLKTPLASNTESSITDPKAIRTRLEAAESSGAVWVEEEFAEGINSVAAPVRGGTGEVIAAIHLHGPAYRFPGERTTDELCDLLLTTADRLSKHLA